jgi:hypothetical protein
MRNRGGKARGSALLGLLLFLASVAGASYFWFQYSASSQRQRIAYLEDLEARLRSETVPIKFMVLSREGGEIKARLRLYDLAGREIAVLERSWPGSELYIDVLLVPAATRAAPRGAKGAEAERGDSWLAFPYRVFTDELSAASGSLLFDAYDDGGFPGVLRGIEWSAREKEAIVAAYSAARKRAAAGLPATDAAKGSFGSAAHEVASLSAFQAGIVYKVVCRVKGGVEIMED